jgi:hypothetical protein
MTYGKWIDKYCECAVDWDFYRSEWKKLAQLAQDYLGAFMQTPEGRARLDGFQFPDFGQLNRIGTTHRQVIERIYRLADFVAQLEYRAGFDNTDGHLAAQIWSGHLQFIPPTEGFKHAA